MLTRTRLTHFCLHLTKRHVAGTAGKLDGWMQQPFALDGWAVATDGMMFVAALTSPILTVTRSPSRNAGPHIARISTWLAVADGRDTDLSEFKMWLGKPSIGKDPEYRPGWFWNVLANRDLLARGLRYFDGAAVNVRVPYLAVGGGGIAPEPIIVSGDGWKAGVMTMSPLNHPATIISAPRWP